MKCKLSASRVLTKYFPLRFELNTTRVTPQSINVIWASAHIRQTLVTTLNKLCATTKVCVKLVSALQRPSHVQLAQSPVLCQNPSINDYILASVCHLVTICSAYNWTANLLHSNKCTSSSSSSFAGCLLRDHCVRRGWSIWRGASEVCTFPFGHSVNVGQKLSPHTLTALANQCLGAASEHRPWSTLCGAHSIMRSAAEVEWSNKVFGHHPALASISPASIIVSEIQR